MAADRLNQAIASALSRMNKTSDRHADTTSPDLLEPGQGGALGDDEAQILSLLGAAVVAEWNGLSREAQQRLFERATRFGAPGDDASLRQDLATFLHDHHERTAPNGQRG